MSAAQRRLRGLLAAAVLVAMALGWALSVRSTAPGQTTTRVRELPAQPLLTYAEGLMRETALVLRNRATHEVSLGELRLVERMDWFPQTGLVLSAVRPTRVSIGSLDFGQAVDGHHLTPMGTCPAAVFRSRRYRFTEGPLGPLCLFFAPSRPGVLGAVPLTGDSQALASTKGCPSFLLDRPTDARAAETAPEGRQRIAIYAGSGRMLAESALPAGFWAITDHPPDVRESAGGYELAVATFSDPALRRWEERPPTDVSVLRLSADPGAPADVIVSARPPQLNLEGVDEPWYHSLEYPRLASEAPLLTYRESIRWMSPQEGKLHIVRLWVHHLRQNRSWLLDARAAYRGRGTQSYLLVCEGGEVHEAYHEFESWGDLFNLRPCPSPDGKQVAYLRGDELCIREVPKE